MSFEAHMTIGGKPVTADEWVSVPNPAHLSTEVGRFPSGTAAHAGWPSRPLAQRFRTGGQCRWRSERHY